MNWQKGTPQMGEHRGSAQMMALEARIKKLEELLNIQEGSNDIEITTQGKLVISALSVDISAQAALGIRAASTLDIKAGALTNISGALVKLNNGGRPVARLADTVAGNSIVGPGSPTVFVP